jgi:hypothetical protein
VLGQWARTERAASSAPCVCTFQEKTLNLYCFWTELPRVGNECLDRLLGPPLVQISRMAFINPCPTKIGNSYSLHQTVWTKIMSECRICCSQSTLFDADFCTIRLDGEFLQIKPKTRWKRASDG